MESPCYSQFIVTKYNVVKTTQLNKWQNWDFNSKLWDSNTHGLNHYGLYSSDLKQMELLRNSLPVWEKNLKKSGYVYMYNRFTLLYCRN